MKQVVESNVVYLKMPERRGLAGPAAGSDELMYNFLTIANFCESIATMTPWPQWVGCHAREFRRMANQLRNS